MLLTEPRIISKNHCPGRAYCLDQSHPEFMRSRSLLDNKGELFYSVSGKEVILPADAFPQYFQLKSRA